MRGWTADDLNAVQRRAAESFERGSMVKALNDPELSEKVLQAAVESMLDRRRYLRMTPANYGLALGDKSVRGFFGHWPKCKGNPSMADLLVVDVANARPPLLIELKTKNVFQPGQKEAIALGLWKLAWTAKEAEELVVKWEGGL